MKARVWISERETRGEARWSQRKSNIGRDYIKEDTRKRGQKGKLIGSLETRTTSERDRLMRSQGTSLMMLRGHGMRRRERSKKLVRGFRVQALRGAKREIG